MPLFEVNRKLLPLKAHYFFLQGGIAPITPFLTTLAKQRGYSAFLVGIMFAVLPVLTMLSQPIFGAITDRFRCQKKIFLWSIVVFILVTIYYGYIPGSPTNTSEHSITVVLSTYQFWLFFIFLMSRNITLDAIGTLTDTMCLQILGKDAHQYGKQRVWGSVGWGGVSIITGWLIDCYSDGKSTKNYKPAIIVTIVFMLLDLFVAFKISDSQSHVVSKHIFKDLGNVLRDVKVASFLLLGVFFGIFHASNTLYLVWHMEELVTKYYPEKHSSVKTLQGALFAIKCFGGAAPFMFLSGKIIKTVGHLNSMLIGFVSMSVRFLLFFIIENPVWLLSVELLTGLDHSLPYSAMKVYSGIIAPDGLKGSVQGLFGTASNGIGVSLGSLISGYLFKKIGTSRTYLVLSVLALFVCVIQILTTRTMVSYRKPKIKDTNLVSTEIKEISLLKESRV